MSKNIANNLIKNIEFTKEYCARNHLILVRVDVPANIYFALQERCYNLGYNLEPIRENNINRIAINSVYGLTSAKFDIEQLCEVPINIKAGIKKPQYIMEMNNDD